MKLIFSNVTFDSNDLLNGRIHPNQKKFSERDRYVLNFIKRWQTDKMSYRFNTSGSTGKTQSVSLSKKQLAYSAQQTLDYLFKKKAPQRLLLCLDPTFIGGTQVITRSILANSDLVILPPSSNPLLGFTDSIDLTSLVPLQIEGILRENSENFSTIKHVLIGGAELRSDMIQQLLMIKSTKFYQTYGMTETASHIAIKLINEERFKPLGDVQLGSDSRGCMRLKGTITNHEWIQTNDVIKIIGEGFQWLGRVDWVINSGGMKISPENVERKINAHWSGQEIVIASIPDDRLGEKVVLISSKPILEEIKAVTTILSNFETPKEEFILNDFPKNEGGKLDRKKIQEWVRSL